MKVEKTREIEVCNEQTVLRAVLDIVQSLHTGQGASDLRLSSGDCCTILLNFLGAEKSDFLARPYLLGSLVFWTHRPHGH